MTTEITMKRRGRRRIPIETIRNKITRSMTFSKRRTGLFNKAVELSILCGSEIAVVVFSESGKPFTFGHPNTDSVIHRYFRASDFPNSPPPRFTLSTPADNPRNPIYNQFPCDGGMKSYEKGGALLWRNRIISTQSDNSRSQIHAQFAFDDSRKNVDSALLWENCIRSTHSDTSRNQFDALFACGDNSRNWTSAEFGCNGSRMCSDYDSKLQWENRISRLELNELELYAKYLQDLRGLVAAKVTSMADEKEVATTTATVDHVSNQGNQSTANDLLVQESSFDDVTWGDIESVMVDSAPNNFVGESQVSDCLVWNEGIDSYGDMLSGEGTMAPSIDDVLLHSSQSVDNPLCDIQWEEDDADLLASLLQMSRGRH